MTGFLYAMNLLFAPFTKVEETADGLIVEGIASSESVDTANDVVDYDSLKAQLPDYEQWMNVRAMHQPIAAGRALVVTPNDEDRTVYLRALIVDDDSIKKVRTRVYKGFSIGGKGEGKVIKRADGSTYTRQFVKLLSEISIVDRPANPDARFTLVKREGADMADEEKPKTEAAPGLSADQLTTLQKLAGNLAALEKASTDPAKIVAMIQAARNELELAGDMDGAALYTQAISLVQQAAGEAKEPNADDETAPADAAQDQQAGGAPDAAMLAQGAKAANLKKAGKAVSGNRMAALEQTVKTLLTMMAGAGSSKAQKAILAMSDGDEMNMSAKTIGAEFTKAVEPLAQALLNVNDRLIKIEALPAPGGPQLRVVPKQIAGQKTADVAKTAMPSIIKAQLDDLRRKAHTDPNPTLRLEYQKRHDELAATYS